MHHAQILITLFINIHDSPYYPGYYPILLYVMPHEYHMGEGFKKRLQANKSILFHSENSRETVLFQDPETVITCKMLSHLKGKC